MSEDPRYTEIPGRGVEFELPEQSDAASYFQVDQSAGSANFLPPRAALDA